MHNNRDLACKRLNGLLKKLRRDPDLLQAYDNGIRRYITDKHAEVMPTNECQETAHRLYYLPHHAVIREDSLSTKLRIVFDASSHQQRQDSLNAHLETGPNLMDEMLQVLLRFRIYKVAMTADIEKAFLQIAIRAQDRDALRFLWFHETPRTAGDLPPIEEWRTTRVPFGVTSSPFLLTATLQLFS